MVGGRGVKTGDNAQTCFTKEINNPHNKGARILFHVAVA